MYQPRHFEQTSQRAIVDLIRSCPLATVVLSLPDGLNINHVPMLLTDVDGAPTLLRCHVARANPVWKLITQAADLRVIFHGPQAYISPGWYPAKQEHGKVVPTWNYEAVHVRGDATVHDDATWLRSFIDDLTATHEASQPSPWAASDAPADYINTMLRAIVGIEIRISGIEAKSKLSQNQQPANRDGVVAGLLRDSQSGALPDADRAMQAVMAGRISDPE